MLSCRCMLVFLVCTLSQICAELCRSPCVCSWIPLRCPPGVPLITDGCGCCKICARRIGEHCNQKYLCDHTQELTCDYSTSSNGRGGTCNYNDNGSCDVNGKVYEDGETFQPSCKLQCKCVDSGVTCIPLCSEDVMLPTPECPFPRRVDIPGKCCQEWTCDVQQQYRISNDIDQGLPGSALFSCPEWSTEWGDCSARCGMGVSIKVTNQNQHCRLEQQSRLCMVRPCRGRPVSTDGALCIPTLLSHPIRLEIPDCISINSFHLRFCGSCGVRNCIPNRTVNEMIDFQCSAGLIRKLMMFIVSCVCY
ncbi:CCN family member 5-like [Pseudophryne corroboree]|uniref:CCN family member 5-like n=1 Tax=Pseudophryne corroboree TaxID=495146 RepID=UPI0030812247